MPIGIGLGVAGVAGAAISGSAAKSAANTQASAEQSAAQQMEQQYLQTRSDLLPYNTAGQAATSQIQKLPAFQYQGPYGDASSGTFDFQPTNAMLEQTPGYQFNLYQGEKATQNSYAAQGLGSSGAALKGAATYASGLADTTYQNQFQNALNTYLSSYNTQLGAYTTNLGKLQNLSGLGENAGAQTGNFGTQTAANIGQTTVGAANASAAGTIGLANAAAGGINGLSNAYLANQFYNTGGIYTSAQTASAAPNPANYATTGYNDSGEY